MIRPSTHHTTGDGINMQGVNQAAASQYMGSYIIMPQMQGIQGSMANQNMMNQALQMQQQILLPQMAGYSMQFPFLQRK